MRHNKNCKILMKKLKYYIYRLRWILAPFFKNGLLTHIDIELNTSCNQKCLSCWHSSPDTKPINLRMNKSKLSHLLVGASLAGIKAVKFNLRGEPLCSTDLKLAVELANKIGYTDIMINTNGILLDKKKAIELDRAGLTTCIISVDSLEAKTYCKIHGCDMADYGNLISNLDDLRKYKVAGLINFNIKLNFHINKINESENVEKYKDVFPMFDVIIRYTENRKGTHIAIERQRKRKRACPHMKRRLTVMADGKIYPCCVCYDEPKDILLSKDFKEALQKRKNLIKNYRKGFLPVSCQNCTSGDIYK